MDLNTIQLINLLSRYISSKNDDYKYKESLYKEISNIVEVDKKNFESLLQTIVINYSNENIVSFYESKIVKFIYYKIERCVIYFNEDGEMIYKGEFNLEKEMFEGLGVFYYEEGQIYEGYFHRNKKNGVGTLTINNELKLIGKWKNDQIIEIIKEQYLKI